MEPTLSLKLSDIAGEVGLFLGYGRGSDNGDVAWTTTQTQAINSCVRSGLRQFYSPPVLPQTGNESYSWSFLKPTAELTLDSGSQTILLPGDFGGLEGQITLSTTGTSRYETIPLVGEGRVRQCYAASPDHTGVPEMAALQPLKGTSINRGQQQQLWIFPAADDDYTLKLTYFVLPGFLDGTHPYAYGGAMHAETILESCLAIAEERLDDNRSVHAAKFMERLMASISLDRRNKPLHVGYNADRSDGMEDRRLVRSRDFAAVTYNGQEY